MERRLLVMRDTLWTPAKILLWQFRVPAIRAHEK
jgi:hypothetical protein